MAENAWRHSSCTVWTTLSCGCRISRVKETSDATVLVDALGGILNIPVEARALCFRAMSFDAAIIREAASRGSWRALKGVVPVCASRPLTVKVNHLYPCAPWTTPIGTPGLL